jgi:predicted methyltransferase
MQEAYNSLKKGGHFGVVEHRVPEGSSLEFMQKSGYVTQSLAIKIAKEVGFELVASSEINANPKDTADHPRGVWTLPPSFRLKDQDRAKYAAIGESDRMTLLFKK